MASLQINNEEQITTEGTGRREALRTAGLLAGGVVLGGSLLSRGNRVFAQNTDAGAGAMATTTPMVPSMADSVYGKLQELSSDVDILNFALMLEHLEADFYTRAVLAHQSHNYLGRNLPSIAQKLRDDEDAHVIAVTQRIIDLGGTPVGKSTFQFPAETFISEVAFLDFAATLEQNGVHAYLGAAPYVKNRMVLRFAASIYGIEARHTSLIRMASGLTPAPSAFETPLPASEIAARTAPFFLTTAAAA